MSPTQSAAAPALPRRPLGRTGLEVTPVAVGGGPLGSMPGTFGYPVPFQQAMDTVLEVLDSPGNFLDTAAGYSDGESERRIGAALAPAGGVPDGFVIATKVDPHPVTGDYSGDQVRRSAMSTEPVSTAPTAPQEDGYVYFPAGFAWGTATASYQIEGAVAAGGRSPSIWDTFSHQPGRIRGGDNGDIADDHYNRYRDDVALLAGLGCTHYRFSLAWPRLQPDGRGRLSQAGLDYYSRLVDELLSHGVQPWVTLYHWDLPQVLEDAGGWPARDTASRFAEYADLTHAALHDRVRSWTTLNEPWCSAFRGYAEGGHAPGRTEPAAAVRAAHHLLLGHGLAVKAMRSRDDNNTFGITLNTFAVDPATGSDADRDAARRIDGLGNRLFLDPLLRGRYPADVLADLAKISGDGHIRDGDEAVIAAPLDFLGVNYYLRHTVAAGTADRVSPTPWVGCGDVAFPGRGLPRTEMGWEIDPDGMYDVLMRITRDYGPLPLYVTENGAAFADQPDADGQVRDPARVRYLADHFRAAARARAEGADLRGYFVWSLLDNFEWAWGYDKRFGLVYVDYETLERIPKSSARFFADVARGNRVPAL